MSKKEIAGVFKRFLLTFLCLLPILIGLGFLLNGKVSDIVMIIIFVVLAGAGVAVEELIHFSQVKKREELKQKEKDKNGR